MSITCDVDFEDNPDKVVYSGHLLRGTVHLTLTESKNVRGVFIKIKGEARVRWKQNRNACHTTGSQEYLNEKTYLFGSDRGEIQLSAGSYHYSFQTNLPAELPSSFEGEFGHIRYKACVVLDNPRRRDKDFEVQFTVIKTVNLNDGSTIRLREPVAGNVDRRFNKFGFLFCFPSDPLCIHARISGGGAYTPGQTIYVQLVADNKSDQEVCAFTVQLISDITYYTRAKGCLKGTKKETIVLSETATFGCGGNEKKTFHPCLPVPQTPPGDDSEDNIVQIRHFCRIIGNVGLFHVDPVITLPVVIGTSPLSDASSTELSPIDGIVQKQSSQPKNENALIDGSIAS